MLGSSSLHSASELGGLPPELLPPWAWKQTGPSAKYPKSPTASMAGWAFCSQQGWKGIYHWLSSPAAGTKILGELGEHSEQQQQLWASRESRNTDVCETSLQKGAASRAVTYKDVDVPPGSPKTQLARGLCPSQPGSFCHSSCTRDRARALQPALVCVTWVLCSTAVLEAAHKSHCCFI